MVWHFHIVYQTQLQTCRSSPTPAPTSTSNTSSVLAWKLFSPRPLPLYTAHAYIHTVQISLQSGWAGLIVYRWVLLLSTIYSFATPLVCNNRNPIQWCFSFTLHYNSPPLHSSSMVLRVVVVLHLLLMIMCYGSVIAMHSGVSLTDEKNNLLYWLILVPFQ